VWVFAFKETKMSVTAVWKIFDSETIAASGTASSEAIPIQGGASGNFAIEYTVTGSGTCKFEALDTYDGGTTWVEQTGQSDIASGITAGSAVVSFSTKAVQRKIKIKCTETGTSDGVVVTARLRVQ
jgi:hypothetical protein